MIEGEPSRTALHVAAARAAHLRFDAPPHLIEDRCAEPLLGPLGEELIALYGENAPSWLLHENRIFLALRARFVEDRLAAAWRAGARQLVVLGAGLDSTAFRLPDEWADLRVYEVDHPATQAWKRARIDALGWALPAGLTLVPCDFEKALASEALDAAGFARDAPAVVSWMGVIYYLQPDTARAALADLHALLAPGSEVVFDYQFPFEDLSERYQPLREQIDGYLKGVGEPHRCRYRADALRRELLAAGFGDALIEEREALVERYLAPLDTEIPLSERFGLAVALR